MRLSLWRIVPQLAPRGARSRARTLVVLFGLALLHLVSCDRDREPPPLVFAAASLSDVFQELGQRFAAEGGGQVAFNFAGSNELARQIEQGAPAHLLVSADLRQVKRLEAAGRLLAAERIELLGNALVVIEPVPASPAEGSARAWSGPQWLLERQSLALADPQAVPAGVYAREWLEAIGVWTQVQDRVLPTLDVRAALAAVASGAAEAGIVYKTDAKTSGRVRVVYEVTPAEGPRVRYYLSPVSQAGAPEATTAQGFSRFLRGRVAAEVFRRHGFEPLFSFFADVAADVAAEDGAARE